AEERGEDREVCALPGHPDEGVAKSHDHRDEHQSGIAYPGDPSARHEGVEIGIVGVLGEIIVELQRPDAEWQVERHVGAEHMAAEAAEAALVIALVEARAL